MSQFISSLRTYAYFPLHVLVSSTLYAIMFAAGLVNTYPMEGTLLAWDTSWYFSIVENGYEFLPDAQSNSGFFPLFPYLWRLTGLGHFGISVLNAMMFFTAFAVLSREFEFGRSVSLFFLALPSLFFMMVPYTESLFFVFSSMLLVGLKKDKQSLIIAGLFFASLVRPTVFLFIPAVVVMEISRWSSDVGERKRIIQRILLYIGFIVAAVGLVVLIQWKETGTWFAYFTAQTKHWHHILQRPRFPLNTWSPERVIWLDGLAYAIGVFSMIALSYMGLKFLRKRLQQLPSKAVLFSLTYLAMCVVYVLFFHNYIDNRTLILSMNRYIFAVPFVMVAMAYYFQTKPWTTPINVIIAIVIGLLAISLGAMRPIEGFSDFTMGAGIVTIIGFFIWSLYVFLLSMLNHTQFRRRILPVLYVLNLMLQIYLFNVFMNGEWVG